MAQYHLSPESQKDLKEIYDYIRGDAGQQIATNVLTKLRDTLRKLAAQPDMGHLREDLIEDPDL